MKKGIKTLVITCLFPMLLFSQSQQFAFGAYTGLSWYLTEHTPQFNLAAFVETFGEKAGFGATLMYGQGLEQDAAKLNQYGRKYQNENAFFDPEGKLKVNTFSAIGYLRIHLGDNYGDNGFYWRIGCGMAFHNFQYDYLITKEDYYGDIISQQLNGTDFSVGFAMNFGIGYEKQSNFGTYFISSQAYGYFTGPNTYTVLSKFQYVIQAQAGVRVILY